MLSDFRALPILAAAAPGEWAGTTDVSGDRMRKSKRLLIAALIATTITGAAEGPATPLVPLPPAWGLMGNGGPLALPGNCEIGTDSQQSFDGKPLLSVRCANAALPSFGGARNTLDSSRYRGKRVRVSGWLMVTGVEDVTTAQYGNVAGEASLWLAVGSASNGFRQDRMQNRVLKGTTGWEQREFVADIPADNNNLMVGFWMQGKGQVWMRDINVEEVPATVALTPFAGEIGPDFSLAARAAPRPEMHFLPPPEKWLAMGGTGFELCDSGVDAQLLSSGQRNLTIACSISSNVALRQSFVAQPWWGKRVRFSAWIRTRDVEPLPEAGSQGGAGLYMSASGAQGAAVNVTGTTDWQYRELVMQIPRNTQWLPLGLMLVGRGQVWARDFKFEEVPADTPVTPGVLR